MVNTVGATPERLSVRRSTHWLKQRDNQDPYFAHHPNIDHLSEEITMTAAAF